MLDVPGSGDSAQRLESEGASRRPGVESVRHEIVVYAWASAWCRPDASLDRHNRALHPRRKYVLTPRAGWCTMEAGWARAARPPRNERHGGAAVRLEPTGRLRLAEATASGLQCPLEDVAQPLGSHPGGEDMGRRPPACDRRRDVRMSTVQAGIQTLQARCTGTSRQGSVHA